VNPPKQNFHHSGCTIQDVHPEDRALVRTRIAARLRGEETSAHYEFRLVRPDGRVVWMECLASQILWDGAPALLGSYHDVTARKRVEDALRRSERLFATIFQSSPDAIMLSSLSDGRLIDVNEAFLQAFGTARSEVIGRTSAELQFWNRNPAGRDMIIAGLRRSGRVRDFLQSAQLPSGATGVARRFMVGRKATHRFTRVAVG
jgi:PAS domain-containing protein